MSIQSKECMDRIYSNGNDWNIGNNGKQWIECLYVSVRMNNMLRALMNRPLHWLELQFILVLKNVHFSSLN